MPRDLLMVLAGAVAAVLLEHAGGWIWIRAEREEERLARTWAKAHPEMLARANDPLRRELLEPSVLPFRAPRSRRLRVRRAP